MHEWNAVRRARCRPWHAIVGSVLLPLAFVLVSAIPVAGAPKTPTVISITGGGQHTCAARSDGSAWCWGWDEDGQLGDGTTGGSAGQRPVPVRVRQGSRNLTDVVTVSAGLRFTCALRGDGSAWCWGANGSGQLGDGTTTARLTAVRVQGAEGPLGGLVAIDAGMEHACAIKGDGTAWCWGRADDGRLGDGTTGGVDGLRRTAVRVQGADGPISGIKTIDAGGAHTCATKADGSVWCWGRASAGQLGDGTTGDENGRRRTAVRARSVDGPLDDIVAITTGDNHTCAVGGTGRAWCWGLDGYGQIGDGEVANGSDPRTFAVRVRLGDGLLRDATSVGSGKGHSCAAREDGSAWCWGWDTSGQLGDGTNGDTDGLRLLPVRAHQANSPLATVRAVAGAQVHSCAIKTDGSAWCWGQGRYGQLGNGGSSSSTVAVRVVFP